MTSGGGEGEGPAIVLHSLQKVRLSRILEDHHLIIPQGDKELAAAGQTAGPGMIEACHDLWLGLLRLLPLQPGADIGLCQKSPPGLGIEAVEAAAFRTLVAAG